MLRENLGKTLIRAGKLLLPDLGIALPGDENGIKGLMRMKMWTTDPDAVVIDGCDYDARKWRKDGDFWFNLALQHNAFVDSGLVNMLRQYFGIATIPGRPVRMGLSSDNTAVTAGTLIFGGTFVSKVFNGGTPSISGNTVTSGADFTKGVAPNVNFSIRKVGLTNATADSTDTSGAAQDIIGGAGAGVYNEPLTIDLSSTSAFNLRPEIDVTLTAV